MRRVVATFVVGAMFAVGELAQPKETVMHHAQGTFTVKIVPLTPAPAEGLGRFSIDKEIHGDLEATTKGEMFSGDRRRHRRGPSFPGRRDLREPA